MESDNDFLFPRMSMGLRRPKTKEQIERETEINGMRQSILRAQRDSNLIAGCLHTAQREGLSGEDTYVLLAYNALILLEEQFQMNMRRAELSPLSPFVILQEPK